MNDAKKGDNLQGDLRAYILEVAWFGGESVQRLLGSLPIFTEKGDSS
ncbi:hypothetical protein [Methylocaldum sp.]|nr:hypothetical protein [Methylocaldum sp.]HYE36144.1 hypothetical protein [Methylocaldum sp.]